MHRVHSRQADVHRAVHRRAGARDGVGGELELAVVGLAGIIGAGVVEQGVAVSLHRDRRALSDIEHQQADDAEWQLFDVRADPTETENVAAQQPDQPLEAESIRARG